LTRFGQDKDIIHSGMQNGRLKRIEPVTKPGNDAKAQAVERG